MTNHLEVEKTIFEYLLIHFRFTYYRKQQSKLVNWIAEQFLADYQVKQRGFFLTKKENKRLLIVNCSAPTKCFFGKRRYQIKSWLKIPKKLSVIQFLSLLLLIVSIFTCSYFWYKNLFFQMILGLIICGILSVIAIGFPQEKCFSHIATLTSAILFAKNSNMDLLFLKGEMSELPEKLVANKYSEIIWLRDIYNGKKLFSCSQKTDGCIEKMFFAADELDTGQIVVYNINRYGNEKVPSRFLLNLTQLENLSREIDI